MIKKQPVQKESFVRIRGGLGNQLFQFAFAYAISSKSKFFRMSLEVSDYERFVGHEGLVIQGLLEIANQTSQDSPRLGRMALPGRILLRTPNSLKQFVAKALCLDVVTEIEPYVHKNLIPHSKAPILFEGYWQSPKYFIGEQEEIVEIIASWLQSEVMVSSVRDRLGLTDPQSKLVMVHVRRGDYVTNPGYDALGDDYYGPATKFIGGKVPNPAFVVFSDEPDRAKREVSFPHGTMFFDDRGLSSVEVLAMMASCDHYITGNSSLSWWGAFLGSHSNREAIVVTPRIWFSERGETPDLFPESWVKMERTENG